MAGGRCRTLYLWPLLMMRARASSRPTHSAPIPSHERNEYVNVCVWMMMMMGARNLVHFKWLSDFAPLSRVCAFCRLFVFLMRADTWRIGARSQGNRRRRRRRRWEEIARALRGWETHSFCPRALCKLSPIGFGALPINDACRCSWGWESALPLFKSVQRFAQFIKWWKFLICQLQLPFHWETGLNATPWDSTLFASFLQFYMRVCGISHHNFLNVYIKRLIYFQNYMYLQ